MPTDLDRLSAALAARPDATMSELANALGISRATLHRRFPGRAALLAWLAEAAAAAAVEAVDRARVAAGPPAAACARLVAALVPLGGQFGFLLREGDRLERLPAVREHVDRLTGAVHDLVLRGRRAGAFRPDLPASYQTRLVLAAVFTAWEAVREGELGGREAADAATAALLGGLGAQR